MLKAMLKRKGTIHGDERWNRKFKNYEDLLTSTFFERFDYLPDDCKYILLAKITGITNFHERFGDYKETKYWPRVLIEPDIVIEFANGSLMIELKLHSHHDEQQCLDQIQYIENNTKNYAYVLLGKSQPNIQLKEITKQLTWKDVARFINELPETPSNVKAIKNDLKEAFKTFELERFYNFSEMFGKFQLTNDSISSIGELHGF